MPLDVFEASSSVQCDKRGPRSAFFIICPHKKTSRWEIGDTEQTYGINSSFNSDEKSSSCFFFFLSSLCLFYSPIFTLFIILSFFIFLSALSLGGSGFLFPLHQTQGQEVCPWWWQEVWSVQARSLQHTAHCLELFEMPCFRIHLKASDRFNACISDTLWKVAMDSCQSALIYRNYFLTHRYGAVIMLCMSACMHLLSLGLHAYTYQCVCLRKQHLVSLFYQWTINAAACSNSHIFTFWISPSIHSPKTQFICLLCFSVWWPSPCGFTQSWAKK